LNKYYYDHSAKKDERGASFSRWAGWGDHRHPIHFSGDADTGWAMLQFQVPFTATAGNVGCFFFWSHDIGGHMGGRNEESYTRWCQFGAMTAALRSHSTRDAKMDRRPWTYPKWAEDSMRKSFHLRSELFPYIYSSVAQSCRDMVPLTRPMYIDCPNDENAYQNPQQFMLGDHLLVAPITSPGEGERKIAKQVVWFPPGDDWYNWFTVLKYEGGTEQIIACDIDAFPLFVRGGAPIPTQPYTSRMTASSPSRIVVRMYGEKLKHPTTRYEDDGISMAYTRGKFESIENIPTETHRDSMRGPRFNRVFSKNESPSGFPFAPTIYFYGNEGLDHPAEWKLKQDGVVLASQTTGSTGKIAIPQFENVRRPDLHKPIELVAGAVSMPISILDRAFDVARQATATASSTESGYTAAGAIDGNASGYPRGKQFEWASAKETVGASIKLEWKDPQTIDTILLYDRPNTTDHVTGGVIKFDDGSTVDVGDLPNDGATPVELSFPAKTVRSLTFTVTKVSAQTQNAGISEIAAFHPATK
ncbi:MAG: discoidin domain-containing protein, partial [Anaerolineae bacterium]|nr:discoidin domain-containing protein [Phycisphaerae bacterium]